MRIGIVCALAAEARSWPASSGHLRDSDEYLIEISGPGPAAALRAAAALRVAGSDALLCWGLAGGLESRLRPGSIVVADRIVDTDGCQWICDPAWLMRLRAALAPCAAQVGLVLASPRALASTAAKRAARAHTGALAVDMESAAVAAYAAAQGCAFAAVRAVIDPAGFDLPPAALPGLDASGETRVLATLAALLRAPGQLPDLLRLAAWYRRALGALGAAAGCLAR